MSVLIIAEKPSVARGIAEAVGAHERKDGFIAGNGYVLSWCHGHLVGLDLPREYPEFARVGMGDLPMVPTEWRWHVSEAGKDQFKVLKKLMASSDVEWIVNACDADREGEDIFRRVYEFTGCSKPVKRFWSTSLVPEQVRADLAAAKPQSAYDGLADSARGRAKADWLVGMNASTALNALYKAGLSCGRVQTPTLALIVERTRKSRAFEPEPFYQVRISAHGMSLLGEKLSDKDKAASRADDARGGSIKVTSVERKREKDKAPKLYDLTSLQRDASDLGGLTAEKTLNALQALYEAKLMTYPRTESRYVMESDLPEVEAVLSRLVREGLPGKAAAAAFKDSQPEIAKVADDSKVHGHGAVLPTRLVTAEGVAELPDDQRTVALLVCARLVEAVMPDAVKLKSKVAAECDGHVYEASSTEVVESSWLDVYDELKTLVKQKSDEKEPATAAPIPADVSQGAAYLVEEADVKEGKTTPPKPYTDSTLLAAMEHAGRTIDDAELKAAIDDDTMHSAGLGTPATRAAVIEGLLKRGYIVRKGKSLLSTERGEALVDVACPSLKTPLLTAQWELELSKVERGDAALSDFLCGIEQYTRDVVEEAKRDYDPDKAMAVSGRKVLCSCPDCGSPVVLSRSGGQWQCSASKWDPDHDFKLMSGDGFKLNVKQFGKKLTENQARSIASGKPTAVKGLKKKDGSTFDAKLVLGPKPYTGWVELAPWDNKPAGKKSTGRKGAGSKPFVKRGR
ncbi:DNA topoisomerase [Ellagibacter isourolithinifaciens]|uniref:type IA DNA topoisomerase n=1 Tax=Ellagibacter isourolithinifaciens TaxID=2137581 RepID=UPI003A91E4BD